MDISSKAGARKLLVGTLIVIIFLVIVIVCLIAYSPNKRDLVGSSTQITQPTSLNGKDSILVSDVFYITSDSIPAYIVYRDTTSKSILYTKGFVLNKSYWSKASGTKAQELPTYYNSDSKVLPTRVVITYSKVTD